MSIRDHDGAVRYWRHTASGRRAVLCGDGVVLENIGGRWVERGLRAAMMHHWNGWETDTRPSVTAAITRTTRDARRRSGSPNKPVARNRLSC